jgi:hypothetical protein
VSWDVKLLEAESNLGEIFVGKWPNRSSDVRSTVIPLWMAEKLRWFFVRNL